MRSIARLVALVAVAFPALGASPARAELAPVRVTIVDLAFVPSVVHVRPGQKVVFANEDQVAHTVTSGKAEDDGVWTSSEPLAQGRTFELVLTRPGTYPYFCKPHFYNPAMHARIVVDP